MQCSQIHLVFCSRLRWRMGSKEEMEVKASTQSAALYRFNRCVTHRDEIPWEYCQYYWLQNIVNNIVIKLQQLPHTNPRHIHLCIIFVLHEIKTQQILLFPSKYMFHEGKILQLICSDPPDIIIAKALSWLHSSLLGAKRKGASLQPGGGKRDATQERICYAGEHFSKANVKCHVQ